MESPAWPPPTTTTEKCSGFLARASRGACLVKLKTLTFPTRSVGAGDAPGRERRAQPLVMQQALHRSANARLGLRVDEARRVARQVFGEGLGIRDNDRALGRHGLEHAQSEALLQRRAQQNLAQPIK